MSYAALATDRFEEVAAFYGSCLNLPVVDQWERANGRGMRFDLGGMRLEILDNARESGPTTIPPPQSTSWGASVFQIRDPDGIPVTFLQWHAETQKATQ
jgi:uncharacterized glyoxalase superfamily protein PhnB